jgi:hypothetical protein
MSVNQIKHLYAILDHKQVEEQVEEQVFEGLRRLLDVLKEPITSNRLSYYEETSFEASQNLTEVRSILSVLALPANYRGRLSDHLSDAYSVIRNLMVDFSFRRDCEIAAAKERAESGTSTQQAECGSFSPTLSDASSTDAKEKPNTAPQDDSSSIPEPPLPPYLGFMVKLATELDAKGTQMKKEEVRDRIEERWDTDALGERSAHKLEMMATLMRPPEAQKGRARKAVNPKRRRVRFRI